MTLVARFAIVLLVMIASSSGLFAAEPTPVGSVTLTQGWATFGQAVPRGLAFEGLQVGDLPTQTDVKNRWADESIRFAVVTVMVPAGGGVYGITAVALMPGSFLPAAQTASVALTIHGCTPAPPAGACATGVYTASVPAGASDTWLSGPLVHEARSVVRPQAVDGSLHPFLRVNFDARVYNDRTARVDVSVENMLNLEGATTVTYDVVVTGPGATFEKDNVEHYYLTRWRKMFSSATFATVTPDMMPFNLARALPRYMDLVFDAPILDIDLPTGPDYDILGHGALDSNMPAHGGRQELAPFPDWTARYLVHTKPGQKDIVLANGDLSGSWPIHVREPEGAPTEVSGVGPERLVSLNQRPEFWFGIQGKELGVGILGNPMPIKEYGDTTIPPDPGQSPLIPDNAHQPSLAYVPYLITGDRYYAEEMAFWANYGMTRTSPLDEVRGSDGILENQETRGYAWALRNLVDAAAYYPGAAVRDYLSQKVTANLMWLDAYANRVKTPANPLNILWLGYRDDVDSEGEAGYIAMWEQNYLAYAIDRANKQGFAGGLVHRDAIARLQLALFSSSDYPHFTIAGPGVVVDGTELPPLTQLDWGAPYLLRVATVPYPAWDNPTYFTTMSQVAVGTTQGTDYLNRWRPYPGYYGPEARLNLMMGVEAGWPGAQEAYIYLFPFIGVDDYSCGRFGIDRPDLACRAGWALDFYPDYVAPLPSTGVDTDGDGVSDPADAFPLDAAESVDTDLDGIGNNADPDDDNDGVVDTADAFPLNAAESVDTDGDLSGNNADPDDDGDGQSDADEVAGGSDPLNALSKAADFDGDNRPDAVDLDDDNDAVLDGDDAFPLNAAESVDTDGDTIGNNADTDDDGDGQDDVDEVASGSDPLNALSKAADFDGDNRPDAVDPDDDNDGVLDAADAFPKNAAETTDTDGDGTGNNADTDDDNDQIPDASDRFPLVKNRAPSMTPIANRSGDEGTPVSFTVSGTDLDGDQLTFTSSSMPPGVALALNGAVTGTPDTPGTYTVTVVAFDGYLASSGGTFIWTVLAAHTGTLTLVNPGPQTDTEEDRVELQIESNVDAMGLRTSSRRHSRRPAHFFASDLPHGLHISKDGLISGRVASRAAGVYQVEVRLRVGDETIAQTFRWTIVRKNRRPRLHEIDDQESRVGAAVSLNVHATDADDDRLTFSATGLPPGLGMNAAGRISGTITGNAREYRVTVTVSDGQAVASETFDWKVEKPKGKGGK